MIEVLNKNNWLALNTICILAAKNYIYTYIVIILVVIYCHVGCSYCGSHCIYNSQGI